MEGTHCGGQKTNPSRVLWWDRGRNTSTERSWRNLYCAKKERSTKSPNRVYLRIDICQNSISNLFETHCIYVNKVDSIGILLSKTFEFMVFICTAFEKTNSTPTRKDGSRHSLKMANNHEYHPWQWTILAIFVGQGISLESVSLFRRLRLGIHLPASTLPASGTAVPSVFGFPLLCP